MYHTFKYGHHSYRLLFVLAIAASLTSIFMTLHSDRGVSAQEIKKLNRFVQSSDPSDTAMRIFRDGRDRIADEDWNNAVIRFRDFINEYPKHKDVDAAYYWLAFALKKQGKHRAAEQQLERLMHDHPQSKWTDDARAMRVEIAAATGDKTVIESELEKSDQEIKMIALQSLFRADPERAAAMVGEIFKPDSKASQRLKETAITLLGQYHNAKTTATLIDLVRSQTDAKLRRTAILWLARTGDESAFNLLQELAEKSDDLDTAKIALNALMQVDNVRTREILLNVARNSPSIETRKQAIFWIGQRSDDQSIETLIQIYDAEKNNEVKDRLIFVFGQSNKRSAMQKLMQIAKSDAPVKIRRDAIFWLGQKRDPEAIKFLEEILK